MRYKLLFIAVYLLLILFVAKVASICPKPSVKKRTIIQSSDSIKKGARLIGKDIVESARECYSLCCNDFSCNVAVMHYKEKTNVLAGGAITEKYCFLFSCGSPSLCTYEYHHRYAVIDLGSRKDEMDSVNDEENNSAVTPISSTSTTAGTTTTTTRPPPTATIATTPVNIISVRGITPAKSESTPKLPSSAKVFTSFKVLPSASITKETNDDCKVACPYNYDPVCGDDGKTYDNKCLFKLAKCSKPSLKMDYDDECRECPLGVPMAMCSDDPCKIISCPTNKDALCKANFCGGCNAIYYHKDGSKVNCSDSGVAVSQGHNEQAVTVAEADYEETPEETLPHAKVTGAPPGQLEKDPYYTEDRRKWLGPKTNNGSGGIDSNRNVPVVVLVKEATASSLMSLPLLIALIICIILLIGVIYRVKCVTRGRAKKVPVDDGDYLINGMYL